MLDVVEEEATIMVQLEGIVCKAIAHVLQNRIMDYYEEVLSLLYSVTCSQVSSEMWQALGLIHEVKISPWTSDNFTSEVALSEKLPDIFEIPKNGKFQNFQ